MQTFYFFVKYLFAPISFALTVIGSTIGLIVLSHKKLKRIGPTNVYKYLFSLGYLNIICSVEYLTDVFDFDLRNVNDYLCKSYYYIYMIHVSISPMLVAYISIERLMTMINPFQPLLLRKKSFQLIYLVALLTFNALIYLVVVVDVSINQVDSNKTEFARRCRFKSNNVAIAIKFIDLIYRVVVPFLLMIFSTALLIYIIFQSKNYLVTIHMTSRRNRQVRFSVTAVLLDLVYLSFCLPLSIWMLADNERNRENRYFIYLIYCFYGLEFYLIYITNFLFRSEVVKLFH